MGWTKLRVAGEGPARGKPSWACGIAADPSLGSEPRPRLRNANPGRCEREDPVLTEPGPHFPIGRCGIYLHLRLNARSPIFIAGVGGQTARAHAGLPRASTRSPPDRRASTAARPSLRNRRLATAGAEPRSGADV